MNIFDDYAHRLTTLKSTHQNRHFRSQPKQLNLSSNDYLAIATNHDFYQEFMDNLSPDDKRLSASSSRLLTGNFEAHERLEILLGQSFGRSVLTFNSGYHMNVGVLSALCDDKTLVVADKYIHASMIDGIRLSGAKLLRYAHQDLAQLEQILDKNHTQYHQIIIATESVFSMDGDVSDLGRLVAIKTKFDNVLLYVDDAHGVGVFGDSGFGVAQMSGMVGQIDVLAGTFGKALASMGGYVVCDDVIREYLINMARPLIFSTALPPLTMAWTAFVWQKMQGMNDKREHLARLSRFLQDSLLELGLDCPSKSHIVPVMLGDNQRAVACASALQSQGFYALAVRPPTVPKNTARVRVCLHSDLTQEALADFVAVLSQVLDTP